MGGTLNPIHEQLDKPLQKPEGKHMPWRARDAAMNSMNPSGRGKLSSKKSPRAPQAPASKGVDVAHAPQGSVLKGLMQALTPHGRS